MSKTTSKDEKELEAFYASLDGNQLKVIRRSDALLESIERDDAEGTFRKGDALLLAHADVPKGLFLKWCSLRWKYHRSYAYRFMRAAKELAPYRRRLVRAQVDRSSLLKLGAKPDMAEEVLAAFEAGSRLTVKQVEAILGAGQGADGIRPEDRGGLPGLRCLHAVKRRHLKDLRERLEHIIAAVEEALAAPRVLKGQLAATLNPEARWAQAELYNLCAFVEPAAWDRSKPVPVRFPEGSGWDKVVRLLYELGGNEHWPPKDGMADWLRGNVLPVLYWAADGDAKLSEKPAAPGEVIPVAAIPTLTMLDGRGEGNKIWGADADVSEQGSPFPEEPMIPRPDGWRSVDEREPASPLSPATMARAASFLSYLRQRYLGEGLSPEAVELTCRKAAEALTGPLVKLGILDARPARAPTAAARLTEEIYKASLGASPIQLPS